MYILSERDPINAHDNSVENTYVLELVNNAAIHSLNHLQIQ